MDVRIFASSCDCLVHQNLGDHERADPPEKLKELREKIKNAD